jgi:acetyl esterase/lipase
MSISGIYCVGSPLSDDINSFTNSLYRMAYVLPTFGDSAESWMAASPWHYVRQLQQGKGTTIPPFLLFNAGFDLGLEFDGQRFFSSLREVGAEVEYKLIDGTTHGTVTRSHVVADHCKVFIEARMKKSDL